MGFSLPSLNDLTGSHPDIDAFVQEILDRNVLEVQDLLGRGTTIYEDATRLNDVKRLEILLAAAELWDRKANYRLADITSKDAPSGQDERNRAKACRNDAMKIAERLVNIIGSDSFAGSAEVSSHFVQDEGS